MKYKKHIFICTNERADKSRKSCGEVCGMELVEKFKQELRSRNLHIEMRAQRTGCLDICSFGPALVVYPDAVFYGNVQPSDVGEIVEGHLIHNKPVERLVIDFSNKSNREA